MLKSQEIKVYNNFHGGILVCGTEDMPKNNLMLKEDKGILNFDANKRCTQLTTNCTLLAVQVQTGVPIS